MKQISITTLMMALIASAFTSCESPIDVPANKRTIQRSISDVTEAFSIVSLYFEAPNRIDAGTVPIGSSVKIEADIINKLDSPFTITSLVMEHGNRGFAVYPTQVLPRTMKKSQGITIDVHFNATTLGTFQDRVFINGDTSLAIELVATAVTGPPGNPSSPVVTVRDEAFYYTAVGSVADSTSVIINEGTTTIEVTSATISGPEAANFELIQSSLPPFPFSIASLTTLPFTVRFMPTYAGTFRATLKFTITGASGSVDDVCELVGVGK